MSGNTRLWDKGEGVNDVVHRFTVAHDPTLDLAILPHDVLASAAHARMLSEIGILPEAELTALISSLRDLYALAEQNQVEIPHALEDCHTAIEAYLIEQHGDAGKRIHSGRSRNDQVLVAVRLYLRSKLTDALDKLGSLASALSDRADEGHIPMPGYTHFQRAMPTSTKMWLHAHYEGTLSLLQEGLALLDLIDMNPLGVGSGFGVTIPLDRKRTADLLGFDRVQRSAIDVQNSRGRYEKKVLRFFADVAGAVEKLACDVMLFSTEEYGFASLPHELTTGSSIMPQKHNPDVVELLRARAGMFRAAADELEWITAKLPSSYHRDFQFGKEPLIRAAEALPEVLAVTELVVRSLVWNPQKLAAAMSPELYSTYAVYRATKQGVAFREAYRSIASQLKDGSFDSGDLAGDFQQIADICDRELAEARAEASVAQAMVAEWRARLDAIQGRVLA